MKKIYVKVATDGGAATAGLEAKGSRHSRLLTVDAVAAWLLVKPDTIYHWVNEDYIPRIKLGSLLRFDEATIAAWIKKRESLGRTSRRLDVPID